MATTVAVTRPRVRRIAMLGLALALAGSAVGVAAVIWQQGRAQQDAAGRGGAATAPQNVGAETAPSTIELGERRAAFHEVEAPSTIELGERLAEVR